ncbi:hypothetical protein EVAR_27105_1 [Eumeta japonica]|uniref:Uncharacterized protein n=1 Tax=Eumeta variegata TaxID=151549 RepID=A0A4C1VN02_EUMVA|nr:hypothetical protein EVAR_27105_1 [Eumeta japonica]
MYDTPRQPLQAKRMRGRRARVRLVMTDRRLNSGTGTTSRLRRRGRTTARSLTLHKRVHGRHARAATWPADPSPDNTPNATHATDCYTTCVDAKRWNYTMTPPAIAITLSCVTEKQRNKTLVANPRTSDNKVDKIRIVYAVLLEYDAITI